MATAASISSPDLWGEATGDRGRNVLLGGLLFLLVNYGLRLPPVASWALRMMGKDPKHLDKQSKYATLHGVATRATGALHNLFAVRAQGGGCMHGLWDAWAVDRRLHVCSNISRTQ